MANNIEKYKKYILLLKSKINKYMLEKIRS